MLLLRSYSIDIFYNDVLFSISIDIFYNADLFSINIDIFYNTVCMFYSVLTG